MSSAKIQRFSIGQPVNAILGAGFGSGEMQQVASAGDYKSGLWLEGFYANSQQFSSQLGAELPLVLAKRANTELYTVTTEPDNSLACGDWVQCGGLTARVKSIRLKKDQMVLNVGQRLVDAEDVLRKRLAIVSDLNTKLNEAPTLWSWRYSSNITSAKGISQTFSIPAGIPADYKFLLHFDLGYFVSSVEGVEAEEHDHDGLTGLEAYYPHGQVGNHDGYSHTSVAGYHEHDGHTTSGGSSGSSNSIEPGTMSYFQGDVVTPTEVLGNHQHNTNYPGDAGLPTEWHYDGVHRHHVYLSGSNVTVCTDTHTHTTPGFYLDYSGNHFHYLHSCLHRPGSAAHGPGNMAFYEDIEVISTWHNKYILEIFGNIDLAVTINGVHVPGSPFNCADVTETRDSIDISDLISLTGTNTLSITTTRGFCWMNLNIAGKYFAETAID